MPTRRSDQPPGSPADRDDAPSVHFQCPPGTHRAEIQKSTPQSAAPMHPRIARTLIVPITFSRGVNFRGARSSVAALSIAAPSVVRDAPDSETSVFFLTSI